MDTLQADELVARWVTDNRDRLLTEFRTLCQQPAVSGDGRGIHEMAELLLEFLRAKGFVARVLEGPGNPVIYAEATGAHDCTLLMYGHYDVQPPEPISEWCYPPFGAVVQDGKLYGRGVSDHRGSMISRIHAVEALMALGLLRNTVKMILEGEEEIGSPNLAETVLRHRDLLSAGACLYPGGFRGADDRPTISCGGKGVCTVRLSAKGLAGEVHSREATSVPNPAWRLIWLLAKIRGEDGQVGVPGFLRSVRQPDELDAMFISRIPPAFPYAPSSGRAQAGSTGALVAHHLFSPTCTITRVEAGAPGEGRKSAIPSRATADLEFRLVPDQDAEAVFRALMQYVADVGYDDVEVVLLASRNPARTAMTAGIVPVAVEAAKAVYGKEPILSPLFPGSGPWEVFIKGLGIPTIADTGVSYHGSSHHAPNEHVRIDDYLLGIRNIAAVLLRFDSGSRQHTDWGGR